MKYALVTIFTFWCLLATAQESGNVNYQNQTGPRNNVASAQIADEAITISVKGLFNVVADEFVASFHLTQVGETARIADSLMNYRINAFRQAVSKNTTDTIGIMTDVISLVPKYNVHIINRLFSKTYQEIPDGFEMKKNIIVSYKNSETLDHILKAATSAEIYDFVKVDHFVKDIKASYNQLREACTAAIKERMKSYETFGFKLDTFRKTIVDDFGTMLPQDRYGNYQAVSKPGYDAVKISTGGGKLRIAETGSSRYYQAVSFDAFDVVLNPIVDRPMVQLTYEVTLKFFVPKWTSEKEKDLLFVNPAGQLQKIDLENLPPGS